VDVNVANNCLKILVIIVQAVNRGRTTQSELTQKDRDYLRSHIPADFVAKLAEYKEESALQNDTKLAAILGFILDGIRELDGRQYQVPGGKGPKVSDFDGKIAGLDGGPDTRRSGAKSGQQDRKEKLKKRQNKLMQKMKKRGNRYLTGGQIPATTEKILEAGVNAEEDNEEEERQVCAFCSEEMTPATFKDNPHGNFAYCHSSKLLYHALAQTKARQEEALRKSDMSLQFQGQPSNEQDH